MTARRATRIGGGAWVIAGVLLLVFRLLHPASESVSAVQHASHYSGVHLLGAVAMVLVLMGATAFWVWHIGDAGWGGAIAWTLVVLGTAAYIADYLQAATYTVILVEHAPDLYTSLGESSGPFAGSVRPFEPIIRDLLLAAGFAGLGIATMDESVSEIGSYLLVGGALGMAVLTRMPSPLPTVGTLLFVAALAVCGRALWRTSVPDDAPENGNEIGDRVSGSYLISDLDAPQA